MHKNNKILIVSHEVIDKFLNFEALEKRINRILDLADYYSAKFTFFVTAGHITRGNDHILKKIIDHGHEIASHSYNHIDFSNIEKEKAKTQIEKSLNVLNRYYPVEGFRAPYLVANEETSKVCIECGLLYNSSNSGSTISINNGLWDIPVTRMVDAEVVRVEGITDTLELGERWVSFAGKGEVLVFHPWRLGAKKYIQFLEKMLQTSYNYCTVKDFINDNTRCCITFDLDFLETKQVYLHTLKHLFRSPHFHSLI